MTKVNQNPATIQYIATGDNNIFQFPFETFEDTDVDVYIDEQLVVDGYSFEANESRTAGDVIFNAPPPAGVKITLDRTLEIEKVVEFPESGTFRAIVMNRALAKIVAYCQQLLGYANRSMRLPPFSKNVDTTLPLPAGGKAIIWSQDGETLKNSIINVDDVVEITDKAKNNAQNAAQNAAQSADTAEKHKKEAAQIVSDFNKVAEDAQQETIRLGRIWAIGTDEEIPEEGKHSAEGYANLANTLSVSAAKSADAAANSAAEAADMAENVKQRSETIYTSQKDLGNASGDLTVTLDADYFEYVVTAEGNINFAFDFSKVDISRIITFALHVNQSDNHTYSYNFGEGANFAWLDEIAASPRGSYLLTFRRYPNGSIVGTPIGQMS